MNKYLLFLSITAFLIPMITNTSQITHGLYAHLQDDTPLMQLSAEQTTEKIYPCVLVHGVASTAAEMLKLDDFIEQAFPGTPVLRFSDPLKGSNSVIEQARELHELIRTDPRFIHGFNMICHSQGGLVGRTAFQLFKPPLPVKTLITLSSPLRGICGLPTNIDDLSLLKPYADLIEIKAYSFIYSEVGQERISFGPYWNDPLHHEEYLQWARLLPLLNCEKTPTNDEEAAIMAYCKERIIALDRMVNLYAQDETIVEPAASTRWAYYKYGARNEIEPIEENPIYTNLGLAELAARGALIIEQAQGSDGLCNHSTIRQDQKIFLEQVARHLSRIATQESQVALADGPGTALLDDDPDDSSYTRCANFKCSTH